MSPRPMINVTHERVAGFAPGGRASPERAGFAREGRPSGGGALVSRRTWRGRGRPGAGRRRTWRGRGRPGAGQPADVARSGPARGGSAGGVAGSSGVRGRPSLTRTWTQTAALATIPVHDRTERRAAAGRATAERGRKRLPWRPFPSTVALNGARGARTPPAGQPAVIGTVPVAKKRPTFIVLAFLRRAYHICHGRKARDNGRSGRHFFATGTVPNHWTRHGDGRHMADKGHPRNHEGRRPCSTRATPALRVDHFRSEGNCRPRE